MVPLRSNLARFVPVEPLDADELEQRKRRAWQDHGLAVIRPEDLPSDWLARGIEAWANERYGRRNASREAIGGGNGRR